MGHFQVLISWEISPINYNHATFERGTFLCWFHGCYHGRCTFDQSTLGEVGPTYVLGRLRWPLYISLPARWPLPANLTTILACPPPDNLTTILTCPPPPIWPYLDLPPANVTTILACPPPQSVHYLGLGFPFYVDTLFLHLILDR